MEVRECDIGSRDSTDELYSGVDMEAEDGRRVEYFDEL